MMTIEKMRVTCQKCKHVGAVDQHWIGGGEVEIHRVWPVWSYVHEEMIERGWDERELAIKMGGDAREVAINLIVLDFMKEVRDKNMLLGDETATGLSKAFCVPKEFFLNLDAVYRASLAAK